MNLQRTIATLCVLGAIGLVARAADAQVGRGQRALREYERLQDDIHQKFVSGDIAKAAAACEDLLKTYPDDPLTYYNLACARARLKEPDKALDDLAKAVDNGWSDADHMEVDEDLNSIRKDKKYAALVEATRLNERAGGKYEKGADIDGVKTIEAFPDEGLRFRIRVPVNATEKAPARLVIWLHPSGASMNADIEKLAPQFAAHGYALMVFSHKQFFGWTPEESDALVAHTLPALKQYKQIDSARPVLMGYAAGGQLALNLWSDNPGAWGGLILDAAYPVVVSGRDVTLMDLPSDTKALKKTPILAVLGDKDPGLKKWVVLENKWLETGVPFTLNKIAGKGHEWMLTDDVLKNALSWLDDIKAGKLPADKIIPRELEI